MSGMISDAYSQTGLYSSNRLANSWARPNITPSYTNPYIPSIDEMFPAMQSSPMFQSQLNPMQAQINPMSFGAARFLQGNTAPMLEYGLPQGSAIPQFNMPVYKPGSFSTFRNREVSEAAPVDPNTMGSGE